MDYVARIHLKTNTNFRQEMVDYCLNNSEQYIAIGWSGLTEDIKSDDFREYYNRVRKEKGKANPAINIFQNAKVDDLLWTRDLNGNYWICKVKSPAEVVCEKRIDIGARIPVELITLECKFLDKLKHPSIELTEVQQDIFVIK